jgi:hypothetical protein
MSIPWRGVCLKNIVKSKLSTRGTSYVLCVICSILAFTALSHTKPIHDFMIQYILERVFATFSNHVILFGISGISGAGGSIGSSNFTCGIKFGNSGSSGGCGICGISGTSKSMLKLTPNSGGSGKFGNLGNSTPSGRNEKRGRRMFIWRFKFDRSMYKLGILTLGIGITGISKALHKKLNLQEYWS